MGIDTLKVGQIRIGSDPDGKRSFYLALNQHSTKNYGRELVAVLH